jgi:hypothetical protein
MGSADKKAGSDRKLFDGLIGILKLKAKVAISRAETEAKIGRAGFYMWGKKCF